MAVKNLKTIDEAWLGLDEIDSVFFNPMSILKASEDDFNLKLSWIMTQPEYLFFHV